MSLGGGECRVGRAAAPWDHHRRRGAESSPPSIATHSAAQAAGAGRAPRRSISHTRRCPRARPRLSARCHKSPSPQLLKRDCCRAPPPSSHRAASAVIGVSAPRARVEGSEYDQRCQILVIVQCSRLPRPIRSASETSAVGGRHSMTTPMSSGGGECRAGRTLLRWPRRRILAATNRGQRVSRRRRRHAKAG